MRSPKEPFGSQLRIWEPFEDSVHDTIGQGDSLLQYRCPFPEEADKERPTLRRGLFGHVRDNTSSQPQVAGLYSPPKWMDEKSPNLLFTPYNGPTQTSDSSARSFGSEYQLPSMQLLLWTGGCVVKNGVSPLPSRGSNPKPSKSSNLMGFLT